jgi:hypothetical protein
VSESRDIVVSKGGDSMSNGRLVDMRWTVMSALQFFVRPLICGGVILLSVRFTRFVGVCGAGVQFGGSRVFFVVRSVVISRRHTGLNARK